MRRAAGHNTGVPRVGPAPMNLHISVVVVIVFLVLFAALMTCVEVGYHGGRRRIERNPDIVAGVGVIEAAIFGLLGLLLAFQFSSAQSRLEFRRNLIVREADCIGTAYLRIDLLPPPAQPALRDLFRRYTDTRIAAFDSLPDFGRYGQKLAEANELQSRIWSAAVSAAVSDPNPAVRSLVLPPINDMIDVTTDRAIATTNHVPVAIVVLLVLISLMGALLAGHAMAVRRKGRSTLHEFAFAAVVSATLYVMVDLEFPRYGLIRNDDADRALHDARTAMK
jgi:hypothetical protein